MGRDLEFHNAIQALDGPTEGPLDLNLTSMGQTLKIIPTFILPDTNFEPLTISHISLISNQSPIAFDVQYAFTYTIFTDDTDSTTSADTHDDSSLD